MRATDTITYGSRNDRLSDRKHEVSRHRVFLVIRPNPILHFAPFLSTHFSPVFEPHVQKWVIFVRRHPFTFQNVCIETITIVRVPTHGFQLEGIMKVQRFGV